MKLPGGVVLLVIWMVSGEKCMSNDNCLNNKCPTARRDDCLEGCKPGWFGEFCQQSCSSNCFCDEESGKCTSCILGWYGADCGYRCSPGCVDKNCERNGTCVDDCTTGSYGYQCDLKCSPLCESGCDQLTGDCVQCVAGRYGSTCESKCSDGCAGNNRDCGRDGKCTRGCVQGRYGEKCESQCPEQCHDNQCDENGACNTCRSGFYGTFCHQACHKCTRNVCEMITGECIKECQRGFYGSDCAKTCKTCTEGICNDATGECTKGCTSGYHGSLCNLACENCKDGDCDQDTGECRHKDEKGEWSSVQSWVGGSVAVVVLIIIAVGFYISRRLKRMHGVVYEAVKWRRRTPSVLQDARPAPVHEHIQLEEEVSTIPPRVCPIQLTRQTSYLRPRLSGSGHNLQVQPQLQSAGVADQQEGELQIAAAPPSHRLLHDLQPSSDEFDRPGSYTLPSYIEINEELMDHLPQPPQGAAAPAPVVNNSSFSVVADVHTTGQVINIPLIAECYRPNENDDSSHDCETPSYLENYDHLFRDDQSPRDQPDSSVCIQVDDESKSILSSECPLNIARPASYIAPHHSDSKVPTQQHMLPSRVSDQHSDDTDPTKQQNIS